MKSQKIQEMSNDALLKRKKTTQVVASTLAGFITVLLIMAIFLCFKKGLSVGLPFVVICFSLSSIVLITVADVKAVSKELQARNQVL